MSLTPVHRFTQLAARLQREEEAREAFSATDAALALPTDVVKLIIPNANGPLRKLLITALEDTQVVYSGGVSTVYVDGYWYKGYNHGHYYPIPDPSPKIYEQN
jgi:hypothetical protein